MEELTIKKDHIHETGIEKICDRKNSEVLEEHRNMSTIWSLALDMKQKHYRLYWDLENDRREEQISL